MTYRAVFLGGLAIAGLAALSACSSSPFGSGYSDASRYRPECSTASSCGGKEGTISTEDNEDWFKDGEMP